MDNGALGEFALGEFSLGVVAPAPPVPVIDRGLQIGFPKKVEDDDDIFLAVWMMYMRQPYE